MGLIGTRNFQQFGRSFVSGGGCSRVMADFVNSYGAGPTGLGLQTALCRVASFYCLLNPRIVFKKG